ncbi:MAG: GNAT family N-acetyltransferase [Ilumatobacteraceae bacterium]
MFGDYPTDRFVGMMGEYGSWPGAVDPVLVAVELAQAVVGVGLATAPGHCHFCDASTADQGVGVNAHPVELEFQAACAEAHRRQHLPPHAHLSAIAVDPFLRGSGVGQLVVRGLLERLAAAKVETTVLECLAARARFYESFGFRTLTDFADAGAPGQRSVLMRFDHSRLISTG